MRSLPFALAVTVLLLTASPARAQQRIAYVDSEYILSQVTEYRTAQSSLDRQAQQWQSELQEMQAEIDQLQQDFEARELLYTEEEREQRRQELRGLRSEMEAFRLQKFGPDGELFREQQRLMRPIQERVLEAIEEVALADNYDYIFDKSGDYLFLYARPQLDVSDLVLEELGIEPTQLGGR